MFDESNSDFVSMLCVACTAVHSIYSPDRPLVRHNSDNDFVCYDSRSSSAEAGDVFVRGTHFLIEAKQLTPHLWCLLPFGA